jgi:uncharacterized protein YciI
MTSPPDEPEADPPTDFDEYALVMLVRGPRAGQYDGTDEGAALQRKHLGHLEAMRQRGLMLAAGPFIDQPDETWRGMCVYRVPLDEAQRLAREDPAVVAGRLDIITLTWMTRKGALRGAG